MKHRGLAEKRIGYLDGLAKDPREGDAALNQWCRLPEIAARRERCPHGQRNGADRVVGAVLPPEFLSRLGQDPLLVEASTLAGYARR